MLKYNRYLGELWLWLVFIEWIYNLLRLNKYPAALVPTIPYAL